MSTAAFRLRLHTHRTPRSPTSQKGESWKWTERNILGGIRGKDWEMKGKKYERSKIKERAKMCENGRRKGRTGGSGCSPTWLVGWLRGFWSASSKFDARQRWTTTTSMTMTTSVEASWARRRSAGSGSRCSWAAVLRGWTEEGRRKALRTSCMHWRPTSRTCASEDVNHSLTSSTPTCATLYKTEKCIRPMPLSALAIGIFSYVVEWVSRV